MSAAFAELAGWEHRAIWGEAFRASPTFRNLGFLRGYAGCPVPEGLPLAIDLALAAAGGHLSLGTLTECVATATGLEGRRYASAILRLAWDNVLYIDLIDAPIRLETVVGRSS